MNDFIQLLHGEDVATPKLRYVDYAYWQRQSEVVEAQRKYWLNELAGEVPKLELPGADLMSGAELVNRALVLKENLSQTESQRLDELCKQEEVTPFVFLLSACYAFLHKTSGAKEIIVETDAMGRTAPELFKVVGTFINLLPFKIAIDSQLPLVEFMKAVKTQVVEGFQNQDYQYDDLLQDLRNEGIEFEGKLASVHLAYVNYYQEEIQHDDLTFSPITLRDQVGSAYPLKIEVQERDGSLDIFFMAKADLFDEASTELIFGYFLDTLREVLQDPSVSIRDIRMGTILA